MTALFDTPVDCPLLTGREAHPAALERALDGAARGQARSPRSRMCAVAIAAGLTRLRRAAEAPFNRVFAVRASCVFSATRGRGFSAGAK
jgi:hypothetical protein